MHFSVLRSLRGFFRRAVTAAIDRLCGNPRIVDSLKEVEAALRTEQELYERAAEHLQLIREDVTVATDLEIQHELDLAGAAGPVTEFSDYSLFWDLAEEWRSNFGIYD